VISINQAIEIIKKNIPSRKTGVVSTSDSLGYVLAEKTLATISSPPYTNSAVDGFAVSWQDVEKIKENNPVVLPIAGESSAGFPVGEKIVPHSAYRISTGAIVPEDLDTIIPIEQCEVSGNKVKILAANKKHQHVRFAGEEFKEGSELLQPGTVIGSSQLALITSLGITEVKVYRKATVTIITTGSELVPFDQTVESHQLRDSNTPMLRAAVIEANGELGQVIHVKDDPQLTKEVLLNAVCRSDLIITSGGVSMGEHDHVRDMALECGFNELFWKVRQKPGKPMFFARKKNTLLMALPGNPVSAYLCFKHYVNPLINYLSGRKFEWPVKKAVIQSEIKNTSDRTKLMSVKLKYSIQSDLPVIEPGIKQNSHMLSSLAHTDGYIIVSENNSLQKNAVVDVFLWLCMR